MGGTPEGFGRIAATTARQVMLQRLRDAENERTYGEFSTHEGEIVAGVIQRDSRANSRGLIVVRMGSETEGLRGRDPRRRAGARRGIPSTATGCAATWWA